MCSLLLKSLRIYLAFLIVIALDSAELCVCIGNRPRRLTTIYAASVTEVPKCTKYNVCLYFSVRVFSHCLSVSGKNLVHFLWVRGVYKVLFPHPIKSA